MFQGKRILAIIPARGGSKGLPGKNIRPLAGKPLIGWTLDSAKKSKYLDEIFVSTDSQEIADVAEQFGIKVPELRPAELASDTASSASVVLYTIEHLRRQGKNFDYIILLEPTSPLRKDDDIDNVIRLGCGHAEKAGVVSLGEIHMEHPSIVKKISGDGIIQAFSDSHHYTQRQQLSKAYFPYGVAYLVKTGYFEEKRLFYGEDSLPYMIERWQCYEVDDIYDMVAIEGIIKYHQAL